MSEDKIRLGISSCLLGEKVRFDGSHQCDPFLVEGSLALRRLRETIAKDKSAKGLIDYHSRHKLLMMAHSPEIYRQMGKLVARAGAFDVEILYQDYLALLVKGLRLKATVPKHINVLQHIFGYFKKHLIADEKQEMLTLLERYRARQIPLIVPITLLNHYVHKYDQPYLLQQVYLNPHPVELSLRNHV